MAENTIVDQFHKWVSTSINAKGVYPHPCFHMKAGAVTVSSVAVPDPAQVYAYVAKIMRADKPDELIFGLDRFCKAGQGTTLKDCIAGAYWSGHAWLPFIIEYQNEPRIVQPINFDNEIWNDLLSREMHQRLPGPIVRRERRTPWSRAELDELLPKAKAKVEERLAEAEAEQAEPVKPLGPMTVAEAHDYFIRLLDLAAQRPLTQRECFIHGQLLSVFQQAVMAEMLGHKKGRYFVVPEEMISKLMEEEKMP